MSNPVLFLQARGNPFVPHRNHGMQSFTQGDLNLTWEGTSNGRDLYVPHAQLIWDKMLGPLCGLEILSHIKKKEERGWCNNRTSHDMITENLIRNFLLIACCVFWILALISVFEALFCLCKLSENVVLYHTTLSLRLSLRTYVQRYIWWQRAELRQHKYISCMMSTTISVIPEKFESGDFVAWLRNFECCATANNWSDADKLKKLPAKSRKSQQKPRKSQERPRKS